MKLPLLLTKKYWQSLNYQFIESIDAEKIFALENKKYLEEKVAKDPINKFNLRRCLFEFKVFGS